MLNYLFILIGLPYLFFFFWPSVAYQIINNTTKPKKNKGSAIFIHITNTYKPTAGCIALSKKDFLILAKLVNKNTKILIS